jgi:hypothetical protein
LNLMGAMMNVAGGSALRLVSDVESGFEAPIAVPRFEPRAPVAPHSRRSLRQRLARVRNLVLTALGKPYGFFIWYPYVEHLQPVSEPYPEVEALLAACPWPDFLREIERHAPTFAAFGSAPDAPVLGRGMFPALDGMAAYAAVRAFRPKQIVEIGSGDSTYFLARGIRDNGAGRITCIDPAPRREIANLNVAFLPRLMSSADAELAAQLEADDILFIDSSHIMLPGMDVDIQFNRLFPRLKPGVIVHIHDIFLPDDYPPHWRIRHYSEQSALVGWLMGSFFEVLWPSQYVLTRHRGRLQAAVGDVTSGGSIWLRKT